MENILLTIFFCVFDMSPNCYLRIVENKIIEMYTCLPLLYDKHVPLLRPLNSRPVLLFCTSGFIVFGSLCNQDSFWSVQAERHCILVSIRQWLSVDYYFSTCL